MAEPAPPRRLVGRTVAVAPGRLQPAGDRMTITGFGERRGEAALVHHAGRATRQHAGERRPIQAERVRELRTRHLEERSALLDIAGDVVEIGERQQPAARVAVEDHQIEFVQLDLEQLARREGDQRQLADRRAVLLFRRPQDGEVHEIDRRVGLEQVAPDAQPRVRLARHQEDAQAVAHAVDEEHLPVVERGDLAGRRRGLDLEHGLTGAGELERQPVRGAGRYRQAFAHLAVLLEGDGHRLVASLRQLLDAQGQRLRLVDHAVARHLFDHQAAVLLIRRAGQQQVQRRMEAEAPQARRHVVDLAVGQDHDRGQARAVDLRQAGGKRLEQSGAAFAARDRGLHHLHVVQGFEVGTQLFEGGIDLLRSLVDGLGRRAVNQHRNDVAERLALFAHHHRVGERENAEQQHGATPQNAARAAPQPERAHRDHHRREHGQKRPWQKRRKRQRGTVDHCPSRSSSAGICT